MVYMTTAFKRRLERRTVAEWSQEAYGKLVSESVEVATSFEAATNAALGAPVFNLQASSENSGERQRGRMFADKGKNVAEALQPHVG